MSFNKILLESDELSTWMHQHTNETEYNNLVFREITAICLLQQALDVEDGIRVLLNKNSYLPGAALALARPLFESYVRGIWLLKTATDDDTDKFLSGEYYFKISNLVEAIGNDPDTDGKWINEIKEAHLRVMHDLTHGGTSHINSRCFPNLIEPNYSEEHLIALVMLGIEIKIRICRVMLSMLQKDDALNSLNKRAEDLENWFQIISPDVSN